MNIILPYRAIHCFLSGWLIRRRISFYLIVQYIALFVRVAYQKMNIILPYRAIHCPFCQGGLLEDEYHFTLSCNTLPFLSGWLIRRRISFYLIVQYIALFVRVAYQKTNIILPYRAIHCPFCQGGLLEDEYHFTLSCNTLPFLSGWLIRRRISFYLIVQYIALFVRVAYQKTNIILPYRAIHCPFCQGGLLEDEYYFTLSCNTLPFLSGWLIRRRISFYLIVQYIALFVRVAYQKTNIILPYRAIHCPFCQGGLLEDEYHFTLSCNTLPFLSGWLIRRRISFYLIVQYIALFVRVAYQKTNIILPYRAIHCPFCQGGLLEDEYHFTLSCNTLHFLSGWLIRR